MLEHLYRRDFPKSCKLVNQWIQEDWLHCREDLIFYRPIYSSAELEKSLIFPEPFGSERLLLGGPHVRGLITRVVRRCEYVTRLCQVVLRGHSEREVAMPASSNVWIHVCFIPNYYPMNIDKRLSRRLSENIW